jgi:hypothetical protein
MSCKAIIQEGKRKGESCQFPPQDDGYCGRHRRNKEYDTLITEGKIPCRQFFRGCNNCVEIQGTACVDCRIKLSKKTANCGHEGCSNKVKENDYCGKHARDTYRDQEKAEGIRYCDIARGCFSLCEDGYASCTACLSKSTAADKKRYEERKVMHTALVDSDKLPCCYCGKLFDKFLTRYGHPSKSCKKCAITQKKNDDKRSDRIRNYATEKYMNMQTALNAYQRNATKKNIVFNLSVEEFISLITSPCHYCGDYTEEEVIGIDRINSKKGYLSNNVVPACWPCNRMKSDYKQKFFIEHVNSIYSKSSPESHGIKWASYFKRVKRTYAKYKSSSADKRKLEFLLTPQEYEELQDQPCYICGYNITHVGLDRYDSSKGYTTENTRPCCTPCNIMKGDMSYPDFMSHIAAIATHPLPTPQQTENPTAAATTRAPASP